MQSLLAQLSVVQIVSYLVSITIATTRWLNAARPLWARVPASVRWLPPVLALVLPQVAEQLAGARTPVDLVATFLAAAALIVPGAGAHGGEGPPPPPGAAPSAGLMIFSLLLVAGCSSATPPQRDVVNAARGLCVGYLDTEAGQRLLAEYAARARVPEASTAAVALCEVLEDRFVDALLDAEKQERSAGSVGQ